MKANKILFGLMASGMVLAGLTQSCVSDAPFSDGNGEGNVRLQVLMNSELTRAADGSDPLMDSCVVYISNASGLLYKYKGVEEIPETLLLKYGRYVAEAWAGDSVPASFNHVFFRGYQPFEITDPGYETIQLTCKIANVAVKVDKSTITDQMLKDWKVTVYNSTGSLEFNAETDVDSIGYYMMPNSDLVYKDGELLKGSDEWPLYTNLYYRLQGTTVDGRNYDKTGLIGSKDYDGKYVEHAHLYTLSFEYNPQYEDRGGSLIEIKINDSEIDVFEEVGLFSRPSIKGVNFDIASQIRGEQEGFDTEMVVKVGAFNGIRKLQLTSDDAVDMRLPLYGMDLMGMDESKEDEIRALGIDWDYVEKEKEKPSTSIIHFTPDFLNNLLERETEYIINIHVLDGNGRISDASMHIAVGAAAVIPDAMVEFEESDSEKAPMSILATQATISGSFADDAVNPAVWYKKANDSSESWTVINLNNTRGAQTFTLTLTNLEPGTKYVYKGVSEDWIGEEHSFVTETPFVIPNGNMEAWGTTGNVVFPGSNYNDQFWDTGNHGAAIASTTLTKGSNVMYHSASTSAELKTQLAAVFGIGKLAAGNLFVGKFGATVGTNGAQLTFGKPYNGTHPSKLSVWVSYTPSVVTDTDTKCPYTFTKNQDLDHGQIYVMFTTEPFSINTGTSAKNGVPANTFMDFEDPRILGMGEITWAGESYGSPDALKKLEIPIKWNDSAKTQKPTTIIIVCSASKYGDYFTGGRGSIMYLDDFELIYDEIK